MSASGSPSFLVIKTSSIGDVVLTTPVAEAVREAYPDGHLAWLVEDKVADVLRGSPFVDDLIVWNRSRLRALRKEGRRQEVKEELAGLRSRLRARRYDICFDLQGFDRTLLAHLMIRARRRVFLPGTDRWRGYTKNIWKRRPRVHAVDLHLNVLRNAGLALAPGAPPIRVPLSSEDQAEAQALLASLPGSGPFVALNPVTTWPAKQWDRDRYRLLGQRLIQAAGARVMLIGGGNEAAVCEELAAAIGTGASSVAGRTSLKVLGALLTQAACLVTSDSGPMHIAAAVGAPVVALFGPTHPGNYGPIGSRHTIIYNDLPCSPCMNKLLENPSCMTGISVDYVFERVKDRLAAPLVSVPLVSLETLASSGRVQWAASR